MTNNWGYTTLEGEGGVGCWVSGIVFCEVAIEFKVPKGTRNILSYGKRQIGFN